MIDGTCDALNSMKLELEVTETKIKLKTQMMTMSGKATAKKKSTDDSTHSVVLPADAEIENTSVKWFSM